MSEPILSKTLASADEISRRNEAAALFRHCPLPDGELLANAGLFEKRQELTKQLFFNYLYQQHIVHTHGVLIELGVRWGQNLVTLNNLRGIYEPYNHNRKLIGFDTFAGFPSRHAKDGSHPGVAPGALAVTDNYQAYLQQLLDFHERECPLSHIRKNLLIAGDACTTLESYLRDNPQTIVAFAWFDFDLYEPTRRCLELLRPYVTRGTVLGFDELNDREYPGETVALREVYGTHNIRLQRNPYSGMQSYFVVE